MINPSQVARHDAQNLDRTTSTLAESPEVSVPFSDLGTEQRYRAGFYNLLAALLRDTPDQQVLHTAEGLAEVEPEDGSLTVAMSMLGLAARSSDAEMVADEYHVLFIGLGRGELVPYGSWYQTGFLMERPLGHLRDDLASLGYQREAGVHEPEDHVAALCEVMMLMINDGLPLEQQRRFFETHLGSWVERFFSDLSQAKAAVFYRAVGRFGLAFMQLEKRYLSMRA